jgi:hypothetical protein
MVFCKLPYSSKVSEAKLSDTMEAVVDAKSKAPEGAYIWHSTVSKNTKSRIEQTNAKDIVNTHSDNKKYSIAVKISEKLEEQKKNIIDSHEKLRKKNKARIFYIDLFAGFIIVYFLFLMFPSMKDALLLFFFRIC